jgi:DNA polymerase
MTEMKPIVSVDFETRSATDLRKTGVYKYAECPTTDIWCMAYAFDDEEPKVWVPGDEIDVRLEDHIVEGGKLRAWNANFERTIWNKIMVPRYKWPRTRLTQWYCTMAQARAMGLPGALGQAAAVLNVEEQKDKEGQALMMRMARPRRTNPDGTHVWWDVPDKKQKLIDYCVQDVHTEVSVAHELQALGEAEQAVFWVDQQINDYGMCVDLDLLGKVQDLTVKAQRQIDSEINQLTYGYVTAATKGADLIRWLATQGVETKSVDKNTVTKMLADGAISDKVKRVLELRQAGAKSSTAKLESMKNAACDDGRMRGLLQYYGAATGRWAGRLVQPQNFPRPTLSNDTLMEVIEKIHADQDVAEYGHGTSIASDLLRSLLIAAPGHRLMFADYSAIEARVLAWIAGEDKLVKTFTDGGDVYKEMASAIYNISVDKVNKDQRQVGKMAILGCGYGMGGKRFAEQCAVMGIEVDKQEAYRIVSVYRETNAAISGYWQKIEEKFKDLARTAMEEKKKYIRLRLKSGRRLTYHNPRIVEEDTPWGGKREVVEIDSLNSFTRQWSSQRVWGGLLTENVVQATARDIMAVAMVNLNQRGYPVVCTVHDEVICEVPNGEGSVAEMVGIMTSAPSWAAGCPIDAEGEEGTRYKK